MLEDRSPKVCDAVGLLLGESLLLIVVVLSPGVHFKEKVKVAVAVEIDTSKSKSRP